MQALKSWEEEAYGSGGVRPGPSEDCQETPTDGEAGRRGGFATTASRAQRGLAWEVGLVRGDLTFAFPVGYP